MSITESPRSKLVMIGLLLMALGILAPTQLAKLLSDGRPMTLALALTIDGLKAGFFLGLALLVIGILRNRKRKRVEGSPE